MNDELSEACAVKNDDKGIESKDITWVKPVENLKGKVVDSSEKFRTRLRRKLEIEAGPNLTEDSELVVIENSISNDKVYQINEEQVSEGETFVELQRRAEHIPETFCTGKKNYDKKEIDTGLASV